MKSLTVAYLTSKENNHIEWFADSLFRQLSDGDAVNISVIDGLACQDRVGGVLGALHHPVKPNVWQGRRRLTKEDWWAKCAALNTAVCLCETEWIAFVDDRSVLSPTWMAAVRDAMEGGYGVNGSYIKCENLNVLEGIVTNYQPTKGHGVGYDSRLAHVLSQHIPTPCAIGGDWWFGATSALPLEWVLAVNGFDETCDGYSMEDVVFGCMLRNNGYELKYDPRMGLIEDRTPDQLGPVMRRVNKGTEPCDKRSVLSRKLFPLKRAIHKWDIREIRKSVLSGGAFPIPDSPKRDWYDGQPLERMVAP